MWQLDTATAGLSRYRIRGLYLVDTAAGRVAFSMPQQQQLIDLYGPGRRQRRFTIEGDGYLWVPDGEIVNMEMIHGEPQGLEVKTIESVPQLTETKVLDGVTLASGAHVFLSWYELPRPSRVMACQESDVKALGELKLLLGRDGANATTSVLYSADAQRRHLVTDTELRFAQVFYRNDGAVPVVVSAWLGERAVF